MSGRPGLYNPPVYGLLNLLSKTILPQRDPGLSAARMNVMRLFGVRRRIRCSVGIATC